MGLDGEEEGEEGGGRDKGVEGMDMCEEGEGVDSFSLFFFYECVCVRVREGIASFMVDQIIYGVVFSFDMVHLGEVARVCGHVLGREDVRGVTGHYKMDNIYTQGSITCNIYVIYEANQASLLYVLIKMKKKKCNR